MSSNHDKINCNDDSDTDGSMKQLLQAIVMIIFYDNASKLEHRKIPSIPVPEIFWNTKVLAFMKHTNT